MIAFVNPCGHHFANVFVNDFTGGIGLRWNYLGIDYAFINALNSSALGNHHLISLIVSSDWIISRLLMK